MKFHIKPLSEFTKEYYSSFKYRYTGDSGIDIVVPEDIVVPAYETEFINTQIIVQLLKEPTDCQKCFTTDTLSYNVYPRSSISKTPLRLTNSVGLIDSCYTGPIILALHNVSGTDYTIHKGQRLAQLTTPTLSIPSIEVVNDIIIPSSSSQRGSNGFGSSGL